ncbi:hypothetical protein RCL1_003904 [Eukaryota sp. TZLM3-RCL]
MFFNQNEGTPNNLNDNLLNSIKFSNIFLLLSLMQHLSIVFTGHVDSGKSTLAGHILYLCGQVDERTLEKFQREAEAKGRGSWFHAYCLDIDEDEREKGKTVEVGHATFVTGTRHYTILDAPGHKGFVHHMIGGAAQADIAVLVISARRGEFETGFDKGGQTREHTLLLKTSGIKHLVVVINKMDDSTVEWSQERYDDIIKRLTPFLRSSGFNTQKDVTFLPLSGFTGANVKERVTDIPWYDGPCLFEVLEAMEPPKRNVEGPVRLAVTAKLRDRGTGCAIGKLESGMLKTGDKLLLQPEGIQTEATALFIEEDQVDSVQSGANVRIALKGVGEEEIHIGSVLCSPEDPCPATSCFDAHVVVMDVKNIIAVGYQAVLHIHALAIEVEVDQILAEINPKTKEIVQRKPRFIRTNQHAAVRFKTSHPIAVETFERFRQYGRFVLRDEGHNIAVGMIKKLR